MHREKGYFAYTRIRSLIYLKILQRTNFRFLCGRKRKTVAASKWQKKKKNENEKKKKNEKKKGWKKNEK